MNKVITYQGIMIQVDINSDLKKQDQCATC